ncbi:hypothetical protein C8R44DRAFT_742795 [Mycena epipterygia]|nr:hypothetical protein C8R44DRAFT_742795 [Mycena epipterygia]
MPITRHGRDFPARDTDLNSRGLHSFDEWLEFDLNFESFDWMYGSREASGRGDKIEHRGREMKVFHQLTKPLRVLKGQRLEDLTSDDNSTNMPRERAHWCDTTDMDTGGCTPTAARSHLGDGALDATGSLVVKRATQCLILAPRRVAEGRPRGPRVRSAHQLKIDASADLDVRQGKVRSAPRVARKVYRANENVI